MSKLQELLDERFPLSAGMDHMDEELNKIQRLAYAEGYIAHQKESNDQMEDKRTEDLSRMKSSEIKDAAKALWLVLSLMYFFGSLAPLRSSNHRTEAMITMGLSLPGIVYWIIRYYKLFHKKNMSC
jgi:hypothetical protein